MFTLLLIYLQKFSNLKKQQLKAKSKLPKPIAIKNKNI